MMTNLLETIKQQIDATVRDSIQTASRNGQICEFNIDKLIVEIPKDTNHGDFSTNIAMQAAKVVRKAPRQVAEIIIENMKLENTYIERLEVAGPGFINFFLGNQWLYDALKIIQKRGEDYGKINVGNGQKVMVEFVSANPTGPLHMGNARGGALGDCIASVLENAGYDVTREYYVNDAGNQIEKFGSSLEARYIQLLKGEDAVEFPEDGYHGDDIIEHVRAYIGENGDKLIDVKSSERRRILAEYVLPKNIQEIKNGLESYGIKFDVWFSEQSLYDGGQIQETLNFLQEKGHTEERDGAIWFKSTKFGADKDEVLVRNNGTPTYFASDIAYHRNKFEKRGFDWVINLLGADHHGHVERMQCAMKALGVAPERLDIVLFQLVRLYRNGEIARMSKRTGKAISLVDLLEEVGRDAARFFFNTKASGNHLDFDLDLAVEESKDNPVFYVQYAHARICSMLNLLKSDGYRVPNIGSVKLTLLTKPEEIDLMKSLAAFPEEVRISAKTLEPSRLTRYVCELASSFHSFYNSCKVKGKDKELMEARMILVDSTRIVIKNVLNLLSIEAPEKMYKCFEE